MAPMSKIYSDAARIVRDVRAHRRGLGTSTFSNAAVCACPCVLDALDPVSRPSEQVRAGVRDAALLGGAS